MKPHFRQFADYNRWANARLFSAVAVLSDEQALRPIGLFFRSIHGTLNHQLLTDRMWLGRLTGLQQEIGPLDRVICDDFVDLLEARVEQDARLISVIDAYPTSAFDAEISYQNTSGNSFAQPLSDVLFHIFNHQTHHRSQAHTGLSLVSADEPPGLDLLLFQRGVIAPDANEMMALAASRWRGSR